MAFSTGFQTFFLRAKISGIGAFPTGFRAEKKFFFSLFSRPVYLARKSSTLPKGKINSS